MALFQKYRLTWPLTPFQLVNIDTMFGDLFRAVNNTDTGVVPLVLASGGTAPFGAPGTVLVGGAVPSWSAAPQITSLGIGGSQGPYALYVNAPAGSSGTAIIRQFPGGSGVGLAAALRFIPSSGVVAPNDGIGLVYQTYDDALAIHTYASLEAIFTNVTAAGYEGELTMWLAHKGADHIPYLYYKASDAGGVFAGNVLAASTFDLVLGGNLTESMRLLATGQVALGTATPAGAGYKLTVAGGFLALTHTTGRMDLVSTTTNNACFTNFTNGGGTGYMGLENSTGNALVGGSGLPFAMVLASPTTIQLAPNAGAVALTVDTTKNVGIGVTTPTAALHLKAGTTAANSAPLKLTSGSLLTTPEVGAEEFLTDKYYGTITTGAARKEFTLNDASLTSGAYPVATTNGRLTNGPTPLAGTKTYWVSDTSGGAVTRKLTFTNGILTSET